jgi:hypothetical protein
MICHFEHVESLRTMPEAKQADQRPGGGRSFSAPGFPPAAKSYLDQSRTAEHLPKLMRCGPFFGRWVQAGAEKASR